MRPEVRCKRSGSRQWPGVVLWGGLVLLSILPVPTAADAQHSARVKDAAEKVLRKKDANAEKPVPYVAALLMEAETGKVLFEKDVHTPWPPASMVKMMTTLIVMERIRDGSLKPSDMVTASRWAARIGGSQIYLKEGETFTVEDLLKATMIHSANDAAVALAEHVAGSTDAFVDLMNDKAEQLGLKETRYHSVHGLPPSSGQGGDEMSAYDLAILGR